jgi:hypothetical protein
MAAMPWPRRRTSSYSNYNARTTDFVNSPDRYRYPRSVDEYRRIVSPEADKYAASQVQCPPPSPSITSRRRFGV